MCTFPNGNGEKPKEDNGGTSEKRKMEQQVKNRTWKQDRYKSAQTTNNSILTGSSRNNNNSIKCSPMEIFEGKQTTASGGKGIEWLKGQEEAESGQTCFD